MALRLERFCNPIEAFWCRDISPYPITAFRILLGGYLFIYFLAYFPVVTLLFSHSGVYTPYLIPDIAPGPGGAWVLYLAALASFLLFMVGYRTRWVTPVALGLFVYHYLLNLATSGCSYDRLIIIFLFILCFADLDMVWSIRPTALPNETPRTAAWPTRLLMLQITLFYFGTGIYKAFSPAWLSGPLLQMTLLGPWSTPLGFRFATTPWPHGFYHLLTWGIIAFECLCGFALYHRASQRYVMFGGLLFHLSIWLLMNIPQFMICPCTYVLFLPPETLEKAWPFHGRSPSPVGEGLGPQNNL